MQKLLKVLAVGALLICGAADLVGQSPETAAEKAKREQAQHAAVIGENEKLIKANEEVARAFAAGSTALASKNYDAAITELSKGIATAPGHSGLPALHANLSVALRWRGIREFNAALSSTDPGSKATRHEAAAKYFRDALDAANEALRILNTQSQTGNEVEKSAHKINKVAALSARAEAYRFIVSKVDKSQVDPAMNAYREYWLVEGSEETKLKTRLEAANMLADVELYGKAAAEFRRVVESDRSNIDALFGLGFVLVAAQEKNNYREAQAFLQKFVELAPSNDPRRADARSLLDFLKSESGS